jgi:uncharacterized protein (TIGR00725 family)
MYILIKFPGRLIEIRELVIGVIGSGEVLVPEIYKLAYHIGELIVEEGWVLLNGGRSAGIMEASAKGAREKGGLTIGVLPGKDKSAAAKYIDIVIATGMGDGRNYINVLSSDIVVSLPGKAGTISEIALALKNRKKVILLSFDVGSTFDFYRDKGLLLDASTPEEAIRIIKRVMK